MATSSAGSSSTADKSSNATTAQPAAQRNDEPRFTISVACRVHSEESCQVSFTTFRRTLIQQIHDSACAFFKISPSQTQSAQLILSGKQVLSFTAQSTVEDLKLTTPDRQSLELVLMDEEPEVTFPVRDQYGHEELLRARLYHPFVDAVRRLLDPDSPALHAPPPSTTPQPPPPAPSNNSNGSQGSSNSNSQGSNSSSSSSSGNTTQQQHGLDVDLYRSSDVSLISLQNSPAACGLQGGEPLLLYRYGRCSREYWQGLGQPERALKPTFAGLYISDYKNQFQGRAVFRHDLAMPLEYLLATYCKWRGIDMEQASFLWLQFYMRVRLKDTGLSRGMDDGDTIYIFSKQDLQGMLWDGVLDGNVDLVRTALDAGARLDGPEGSFEAITSRWPLHAAAANNHLGMARLLVERGADVDKLDAVSEPALWHAVEQGHGPMVSLLLELGATASDLPAPQGRTKADYAALCHAAEKGSLAMVQLLLDKGANPYTYDDTGYCAYDYLVDQAKALELLRALLNADSQFASTQRAYQQAYQRLCAAVKRAQRYPALGCNCRTCNSVVEVRAAEAEATQTLKAQIGCVALVRAVQAGGPHCLDAMKLLYEHGALLDGQDQDGRTALHQAIRYNRLAEAKWLVSAGAHLDVPDFEGLLPLHQAACTGNVEFAKLLVEAGAPINLHTVKYITQESLEAQTKKQEANNTGGRKAAKKRNALDVTGLTTIGGNSALALAVRHGHAAVVEYLLSQQAVFDLKNPADSSAFHAALDRGAASVASKLLQHLNKPKPGKALPATSSNNHNAATKVKAKNSDQKEKVRRVANQSDSGAKAGGTIMPSSPPHTSDSDGGLDLQKRGDTPFAEPPVAVDAGAGLREIVQAERERLRQEKGLARSQAIEPAAGTAAANLKPAQSLMQQLEELKAKEKARLEAEAAAAERARVEEAARKKAEEEARRKAEEETKKRAEAEAAAKKKAEEEARRKAEEEAAGRRKAEQEARKKAAEEEAKRKQEEAQRQLEAEQRRLEEEKERAVAAEKQEPNSAGSASSEQPATANGCAAQQQQGVGKAQADAAAAVNKSVQILFRSTSTPAVTPKANAPCTQQGVHAQSAGNLNSNAPAAAAGAGKAGVGRPTNAVEAKAAAAAAHTQTPTAASKKPKGKARAAMAAAANAEDLSTPSSGPGTPGKHQAAAERALSGPVQAQDLPAGAAGAKPGANASGRKGAKQVASAASVNTSVVSPTAAALAASAALHHPLAAGHRAASGTAPPLAVSNGPLSTASADTLDSMQAIECVSPRQTLGHHVGTSSTLGTPVRNSKPPSRRNSFSSANGSSGAQGLGNWGAAAQAPVSPVSNGTPAPPPGIQTPGQGINSHATGAQPQLVAHTMSAFAMGSGLDPFTRASSGLGLTGVSSAAGNQRPLSLNPNTTLSPLRHGSVGGRLAGNSPTAAVTDEGFRWDESHLESVVASVLPDEFAAPTSTNRSTHSSFDTLSTLTNNTTAAPVHSPSPFGLGLPPTAAATAAVQQAWETALPGSSLAANALSSTAPGTPRSGATAPGNAAATNMQAGLLDRASSADLMASSLLQGISLPASAGGSLLAAGAAPFVPGEQSHWRSSANSIEGRLSLASPGPGLGSTGSLCSSAAPRELDPLPALPASLFEDDDSAVSASPSMPMNAPSQRGPSLVQTTGPGGSMGSVHMPGNNSAGSTSNQGASTGPLAGSGMHGGSTGASAGGMSTVTPGMASTGAAGRRSPVPPAGALQQQRASSRGRPGGTHARAASSASAQDNTTANTGRFGTGMPGSRMGAAAPSFPSAVPGGPATAAAASSVPLAPSPQPGALPNLYQQPSHPSDWYLGGGHNPWQHAQGHAAAAAAAAAAAYAGLGHAGTGAHVPGMQPPATGHSSSMYPGLGAGMGTGILGPAGWGDSTTQASYWGGIQRPPGIAEVMGGPRAGGRGGIGQPPRYRQH